MDIAADAMNAAKHASKVAVDLFNDESLVNIDENRNVRKAVYIPTFFTSVQQEPVAGQQLNAQRFSRDAQSFQGQSFDAAYRPSSRAVY